MFGSQFVPRHNVGTVADWKQAHHLKSDEGSLHSSKDDGTKAAVGLYPQINGTRPDANQQNFEATDDMPANSAVMRSKSNIRIQN